MGRSVVTGSSTECADFPRDYPSRHGVLEAPHTKRASPLLAGCPLELLPARAIQLPDKEFRSCLIRTCLNRTDATSLDDVPACRHAEGTISSSDVIGCLAYGL